MDNNIFQTILKTGESENIEFKVNYFHFENIIKNIIGFSNNPRTEPAYIIIGIQEYPSLILKGLTKFEQKTEDEILFRLKQKVNPVPEFKLYQYEYEKKIFDIIEIPPSQNTDLFFLEGKVYLRLGTQNQLAKPEDIKRLLIAEKENIRLTKKTKLLPNIANLFTNNKEEIFEHNQTIFKIFEQISNLTKFVNQRKGGILLEKLDDIISVVSEISEKQNKQFDILTKISTKQDEILSKLVSFYNDFTNLKSILSTEFEKNEENYLNLYNHIDKFVIQHTISIDDYIPFLEIWLVKWNLLEEKSFECITNRGY